jgi:hypothetical protein
VDAVGSGHGPVAGCCEYGDEPSGSGVTELDLKEFTGKTHSKHEVTEEQ